MKFVLLTILFFSFNTYSGEFYLVIDQEPHALEKILKNFDIKMDKGRTLVVKAKKKNKISKDILKYLRPIKLEDVQNYSVVLSKAANPNKDIVKLLADVSAAEMKTIVEKVSSFSNRKSGAEDNLSTSNWILGEFNKLGLKSSLDCFRGKKTCNVYGHLKGSSNKEDTILVEAHLDSVGHAMAGSDDNASGIAGLLMIAKRVVKFHPKKNFIFFATNAEENGLLGSKYYARKLNSEGNLKKIKFVINMDMIGYNFTDQKVDLETNAEFKFLAEWMGKVALTYTSLEPNIVIPAWGSDHVPFLERGIPTLLTIEHWPTKTPCYHARCDLPDHLNYDYGKEIVKLNIAASYLKDNE